MFASKVTDTVTIHDATYGAVIVTIQKLSWKSLEKAEELQSDRALSIRARLGPQVMQALQERQQERELEAQTKPEPEPDLETRREKRYRAYDRDLVIRAGVKSLAGAAELPKLPAALEDLDEVAGQLLHRAILDLSLPALEPSAEDVARKNA